MIDENYYQPFDSYDDDELQTQRSSDLDLAEEDENADDDSDWPPAPESTGQDNPPAGIFIDPWAGHEVPPSFNKRTVEAPQHTPPPTATPGASLAFGPTEPANPAPPANKAGEKPMTPAAKPQNPFAATTVRPTTPPTSKKVPAATGKNGGDEIEQLIKIGEPYHYYCDDVMTEYVDVPGFPYAVEVDSKEFIGHLTTTFWNTNHAAVKSSTKPLVRHFQHIACLNSKQEIVNNRFAYKIEGEFLTIGIDLANSRGEAIVVNRNGWHVTAVHGFKFKRYPHMHPLPAPSKNGDLLPLFDLTNLQREQDKLLVAPWLVIAPNNSIPRPILALHGLQGSAKTVTALMLRNIIDPISTGGIYVPNSTNELAQNLHHHAVPLFDNITNLHKKSCDILCLGCTGGGISKRQLYSNANDVLMHFKRPIIITGVTVPFTAQDLLDRSFAVELALIDPARRAYEADLWAHYEAHRPLYLGGLLDVLAAAMGKVNNIQLDAKPRLADYCRWACAVAEVLGEAKGFGKDRLLAAMFGVSAEAYDQSIADDPLAYVLLEALNELGEMDLLVSELHEGLAVYAPKKGVSPHALPKSPAALSRKLKVYRKLLETKGWQLDFSDTPNHCRIVTITRLGSNGTDGSPRNR